MNKQLQNCLSMFDEDILRAVVRGELPGEPFVRAANEAAAIFRGFRVVIDLVRVSETRKDEAEEGGHDDPEALDDYETDALLDMLGTVSNVMTDRLANKAVWAREQIKPREQSDTLQAADVPLRCV